MELFAADGHDAGGCERVTGKSGMRPEDIGRPTRFEVGDREVLHTIREMSRLCRVLLSIFVVQPGLSKSAVTINLEISILTS